MIIQKKICAGFLKPSMGARNRVGIGGVVVPAHQASQPGGIRSLESILGLLKSLKIWALVALTSMPWTHMINQPMLLTILARMARVSTTLP